MTAAAATVLAARALLVVLFFPFSALDKLINFRGAVGQASEFAPGAFAVVMILMGLAVEIIMPLAILTGTADRAAGLILALYCMVTAILWKQFWKPGDFWHAGDSRARNLFWDFLKNFSLAGGFLLLVVGTHGGLGAFLTDPLASSHPYSPQVSP
jgi:putative oxidoreductase